MIDDINIEIQQMCNDLLEEAKAIAQLPPVSHLSKSKNTVLWWNHRNNTRLQRRKTISKTFECSNL